jgi:hypothetical protein
MSVFRIRAIHACPRSRGNESHAACSPDGGAALAARNPGLRPQFVVRLSEAADCDTRNPGLRFAPSGLRSLLVERVTPFRRPIGYPVERPETLARPSGLRRSGRHGPEPLALHPPMESPASHVAGAGCGSPPLPVNPDHAPADNRNGGTSMMIREDWINGRFGIPDSVSPGVHRPVEFMLVWD